MSIMATEEKNNISLVSISSNQPPVPTLIVPSPPPSGTAVATSVIGNQCTHTTITALGNAYFSVNEISQSRIQ